MPRILITSALPYINGIKHLGNLIGSMLPADVFARYHRSLGNETLYICATDEHGTPAELAAANAKQKVDVYCAEQHQAQRDICSRFGLSWDYFGRTSSQRNHQLTQHFARVLESKGLIEERVDRMIYSLNDERFLPDRYVEGKCPKCGFESARGDQCDKCSTLLDPTDLIDPYSAISGSKNLELRETRHIYFLQSKLQDAIQSWIDAQDEWPALAKAIADKHLKEGLHDRGISRDLGWGVSITDIEGNPRQGFENKVFYVWFDAPISYISTTMDWASATGNSWERWWRTDNGAADVRYVQFMGKDNVAFHTVSFPATIIGAQEPWKKVDTLKAFNWLNWYGEKFSTSHKRGVFMDTALELLPADVWRWYLLSHAPETSDTSFTWEQFCSSTNSDLADVLGNFVNRVLKFCMTQFDGLVPAGGEYGELEAELFKVTDEKLIELANCMDAIEIRKSTQILRSLWVAGNEYLQAAAPWKILKTDRARAAVILRTAINLIYMYSRVSEPFIPFASAKMSAALGHARPGLWPRLKSEVELSAIRGGSVVLLPELLFPKIEEAQIQDWASRFGGVDRHV